MLLEARGLVGGYGKMMILKGVTLAVDMGAIAVIVGPNGAGKSTALKAIFGLIPLHEGSVELEGQSLAGLRADQMVTRGLALVPQSSNVFASLSIQENLEMGAFQRRDDFSATLEKVYEIFPPLRERRTTPAGQLSGGQRQMLAMGRAMMSEPRVLLLDEPTAGLSPVFVEQTFRRQPPTPLLDHLEQRALAGQLHALDNNLIGGPPGIGRQTPGADYLEAVFRLQPEPPQRAPPDDPIEHSVRILEPQIAVPGPDHLRLGNLTAHAHHGKAVLDRPLERDTQFADR